MLEAHPPERPTTPPIPLLIDAALLGAAGAVAWIYGSNLILGQEGTLTQFSGAVLSGIAGGPAGVLITEASGSGALGAILGAIITGVIYTLVTAQVPQAINASALAQPDPTPPGS